MAAATRAPGHAILTETNALLYPEGSELSLGATSEELFQALDGKLLLALQRAVSCVCGDVKVRMAPGGVVPAGVVGFPVGRTKVLQLHCCLHVCSCPRWVPRGSGGSRGNGAPCRAPCPHLLRGTLHGISQPAGNWCLCQNHFLLWELGVTEVSIQSQRTAREQPCF